MCYLRDPNTSQTLQAFDGAVQWALAGKYQDQDIDEAKLATFAKVSRDVYGVHQCGLHVSCVISDEYL